MSIAPISYNLEEEKVSEGILIWKNKSHCRQHSATHPSSPTAVSHLLANVPGDECPPSMLTAVPKWRLWTSVGGTMALLREPSADAPSEVGSSLGAGSRPQTRCH